MNLFVQGLGWVFDPAHYGGMNGIDTRTREHLAISGLTILIAAVIAIPIGFYIGHTGRGRSIAIGLSGGVRALPTLGFIAILALSLGIGLEAPLIALIVLAIPSVLAGAYSGFEAVDPAAVDSARAIGMTEWQIVTRIELPLGLPLLIGGLRLASLQVIATAALADYVGAGGLGHFIFLGLQTQDYPQMVAGSIMVVVLALLSEAVFSILQRLVVPTGVTAGQPRDVRARSSRSRTALG